MRTDTGPPSTSRHHRIAWVLMAITGLPFLVFGLTATRFGLAMSDFPVGLPGGPQAVEVTTGVPWEQVVAEDATAMALLRGVSRVTGLAFLTLGALVVIVAAIPFRRGQRWSWFALWVMPAFMVGLLIHELSGEYAHMPLLLLTLSLVGLLLPYRSFFPRRS